MGALSWHRRQAEQSAETPFGRLFAQHSAMVKQRAAALVWDAVGAETRVEQVVEEVFIQFIKAARQQRAYPTAPCAPQLYHLTTQVALRQLQRMRRRLAKLPVARLQALKAVEAVKIVLAQSDFEVAQVAAHAYFDGLSINALANLLHLSPLHVAHALERFALDARRLLRQPGWVVTTVKPRDRAHEAWRGAGLQPLRSTRCMPCVTLHQMASGERGMDVGAQAHLLRCLPCRTQLRQLRVLTLHEAAAQQPMPAAVQRLARRGVQPSWGLTVLQEAVPLTLLAAGMVTATLLMF